MQNNPKLRVPAPVGSWLIKSGHKFQSAAVLFTTFNRRKEVIHG